MIILCATLFFTDSLATEDRFTMTPGEGDFYVNVKAGVAGSTAKDLEFNVGVLEKNATFQELAKFVEDHLSKNFDLREKTKSIWVDSQPIRLDGLPAVIRVHSRKSPATVHLLLAPSVEE